MNKTDQKTDQKKYEEVTVVGFRHYSEKWDIELRLESGGTLYFPIDNGNKGLEDVIERTGLNIGAKYIAYFVNGTICGITDRPIEKKIPQGRCL